MGKIGVDRSSFRQRTTHPGESGTGEHGHMNTEAAIEMTVIRTPQGDQLTTLFLDRARQRE